MQEYWLLLDDDNEPLIVRDGDKRLLPVFTSADAAKVGLSGSVGSHYFLEQRSRASVIQLISAYDGTVRDYRPDSPFAKIDSESL